MSEYKLYQYHSSGNCYKIRLLLHLLNIEYEIIEIDILQKASRTPEFLKINPNGRIPVLEHQGRFLPESNAALWYLAKNTPYLSSDNFHEAQTLQWMFFEQYSHEPFIATSRYWISILKAADQYQQQLEQKQAGGYAALDVMEKHLGQQDFFVANRFSIADIALYAYTHVAAEGNFNLTNYQNIQQWCQRIESRPGYISITKVQ
jgi:glutathione S-transferase